MRRSGHMVLTFHDRGRKDSNFTARMRSAIDASAPCISPGHGLLPLPFSSRSRCPRAMPPDFPQSGRDLRPCATLLCRHRQASGAMRAPCREGRIGMHRPKTLRCVGTWWGALALCACPLVLWSGAAAAQDWPAKPVKIVVPFSPGGSSDQLARLYAAELSASFKQQFYVENRAGSSGAVGSAQVARAEPDGYTFVNAGSGPHLTGPAINLNIGYDPLKDFTHVAMEAADSFVLIASAALGAASIADLIRVGRGKPLTSASPGPGSLGHLLLERLKRRTGLDIQHVPAANSGMNEVLGNHISLTITTLLTSGEQIKAGKVMPLAVATRERHPAYP